MAQVLEFKCPCCSGAIRFDSTTQKMRCPYCDTEFDLETLQDYEKEELEKEERPDWKEADESDAYMDDDQGEFVSYVCEACGGEIIADRSMASSRCPYCDNPVIVMKQLSGELKPDLIIPFKLEKQAAQTRFRDHLKGKLLLPAAFRSDAAIEEIKGVYVPFWLFNCKANADIRCRATKVRIWRTGKYEYTDTSHYLVSRAGDLAFERVPADGSLKMADDLMDSVEPYDYQDARPFQMAYLAGFLADKYDVSSEDCYARANERIEASTERQFMDTIHGYATCIPEKKNIEMEKGEIQYALLPVWLLHARYHGELFTFAMNGQTGKFVGNLPMAKGKAALLSGGVFMAVAMVTWLILTYLL